MRTIRKKIGLSLAAFACVVGAGVGVALGAPQMTTAKAEADPQPIALADRDYYISGAGIRLVENKAEAALRFHTNLLASEYAKVEQSGTLIIPEFYYDGELTLDDLNNAEESRPTHIVTKGEVNGEAVDTWTDVEVDGEAFKRSTAYLYNLAQEDYGTRMVVVSYVKIAGAPIYTSILDGSNYISLSNTASAIMNTTEQEDVDRYLSPFVVDKVQVSFVTPNGTTNAQVAYGEKVSIPTVESLANWYEIRWVDQYGKVWDFDNNVATYPLTLTAELTAKSVVKQISDKALGDAYDSNSPQRAWVNGSTPEILNSGVPSGFTTLNKFTWYKDSTAAWKMGSVTLDRTCFDQTDISNYSEVKFMLKVETESNARFEFGTSGVKIRNEWLTFHLVQTAPSVWTLNVYQADGSVVYHVENISRIASDTLLTVDSVASLVFPITKTATGEQTHAVKLLPPSTKSGETCVYATEVLGTLKCDGKSHTEYVTTYNGNGTHSVLCSCGEVIQTAACEGPAFTCGEAGVCDDCKATYTEVLQHNFVWTEKREYVCDNCGESRGVVATSLQKQNVVLYTDASSIAVNQERAARIDISTVTDMSITAVKNVELNGVAYEAILRGETLTIYVIPKQVFGEYNLTATIVVEEKEFDINVPVLVVTNMITTPNGMKNMRFILRGADLTTPDANGSIGGKGGVDTMEGNGYYMLGANIDLTDGTYVYGTSYVPFIGTFDGNGYSLIGYGWSNWYGSKQQDISSSVYGNYLEGSLFGVIDGLVKNVAFTECKFGIFENIMHSGNGVFEDCYIEIIDTQTDANTYTPGIFSRGEVYGTGMLRNVVIDVSNFSSPILDAAINTQEIDDLTPTSTNAENVGTRYMSLAGKCYTAENVLVYGFNKKYISVKSGRGDIYVRRDGSYTNGFDAGIRVEYTDGSTNRALFACANLNADIWKLVDGVPYLHSVSVSGTVTKPSQSSPTQIQSMLNDYIARENATQYYIAWDGNAKGTFVAVKRINSVMYQSTGATLDVGGADADNTWKKQIILGTFADYQDKIDSLNEAILSDDSYGVYLVGKTFFILADNEASFEMAGEEFCRRIFGWTELSPNNYTYDEYKELRIPSSLSYTTEITFTVRAAAFSNITAEEKTMNFAVTQPYTQYSSMHNALDYFKNYEGDMTNMLNVNSESDEKEANKEIHGEQLCYTARGNKTSFEAMLSHVVNEIVQLAQEKPAMTAVNFMIEDDPDYCGCDCCKQFSNPSITQLLFLNELSYALANNEVLRKANRTIAVEFFAYSSFYNAPVMTEEDVLALTRLQTQLGLKAGNQMITLSYADLNLLGATYAAANDKTEMTVLQAEDNLRLWWTSHKANHAYPLSHQANDHMYLALLAWVASVGAANIDIFMYQATYRDYFLPLNTWEYQIIWYQELNTLGINSFMFNLGNAYNSAEAQTAFSAFKTYIDSRAMTDLNVTFEQLKDEFFSVNGYYGAAGPKMRTFFEELVEALESKKQDGSNPFLSLQETGDYLNSANFRYYETTDSQGNTLKTTTGAERIQSFFNGTYGLTMNYLLFKAAGYKVNAGSATTYTLNATKSDFIDNIYILKEKYGTQLATLEAWQTMCYDALAMVDENSDYARRIKTESLFPEYAILLLYSDYSITYTRSSNGQDWASSSIDSKLTVTTKYGLTYQSLYNKVLEIGMNKPSEFFQFNAVGLSGNLETLNTSWMSLKYTYKQYGFISKTGEYGTGTYISASFFVNWGVVQAGK